MAASTGFQRLAPYKDVREINEEVPVSLWYVIFLWLDTIEVTLETRERTFIDGNVMIVVQLYRGELRYAYGEKPKTWMWVEE